MKKYIIQSEQEIKEVYVAVSVEKELPEVDDEVTVIASKFGAMGTGGHEYRGWIDNNGKWHIISQDGMINDYNNNFDYWKITHYLKPIPVSVQRETVSEGETWWNKVWDACRSAGMPDYEGSGIEQVVAFLESHKLSDNKITAQHEK